MCSFINFVLRHIRNSFPLNLLWRLIINIMSRDSIQQFEAPQEQSVSPSLTIYRNKIIGDGRYRIVFKGTWEGRKVAVKRILKIYAENNTKEEDALRKCHHPNIIELFHVDSESNIDFKYYALELCEASLDRLYLEETDPKKYRGLMPATKDVFLQLATGLAHIHEKGLIHRDLKPENVLISVDSTGENVSMKWADFGLSKQVNERGSHSISRIRGTENWYAPEIYRMQIEEKNMTMATRRRGTVKSDVFTEGLVFGYHLLNGNHPYGSLYDVPINIINDRPVNLNEREQQNPMLGIIMDMLKNNPDERIILSSDVVTRITNIE